MSDILEVFKRNAWVNQGLYTDDKGQPIDVTGYTVKIIVKRKNDNSENDNLALVNKSYVIQDGTEGTFDIALTNQETNIPAAEYIFEVQLSKGTDIVTINQSRLIIKETYIKE
jgi:RNase P/RNase MRP subunit p29